MQVVALVMCNANCAIIIYCANCAIKIYCAVLCRMWFVKCVGVVCCANNFRTEL